MTDYVIIQKENVGLGQIAISHNVVDHIVREIIDKDEHVFLDEIRGLKTAPEVQLDGKEISISMKVRVQYGKNVEESCRNLQKELQQQLELMVDYHNPKVEFNVVGFKFD